MQHRPLIPLPIDAEIPLMLEALRAARSLVVVAEPGAGKTTRLPPAIVRSDLLSLDHPNLVMLQPRRVAARAAAQRIADENGWELGREVGHHIRFERRIGPHTRLRVLTEGILTRQLLADPFLPGVGAVVLDEFHERSIHIDLALAMLREVRATVRPDLMLVVMSATLDADPVVEFLGHCPIVKVPGRTFPVTIDYRPHAASRLPERVAQAVENAVETESNGDVLVFLPGAAEINRVMNLLSPLAKDFALLPLHGSLPGDQQTLALLPNSRRKIILATNIAETSLTIDGMTLVIDSGLARVPMFDARRGLDHLELKRISQASATQRAGRAGRTRPGRCIRLWSAKEQAALEPHDLPEIARVDLCATILDLHGWGKPDPASFGWFESPPIQSISSAQNLLQMLGALDESGITHLGHRLVKLPVHPRLGRLLLAAAHEGCANEGAAMAALLSEKDILRRPPPMDRTTNLQGDSDLLLRLAQLSHSTMDIDPIALRQVKQTRDELLRIAKNLSDAKHSPSPGNPGEGKGTKPARVRAEKNIDLQGSSFLKLPLLAYPDRVCRRRAGDSSAAVMVGGGGVRLDPQSIVRQGEFIVALDARGDARNPRNEAAVAIASAIDVRWLAELFPQSISRTRSTIYDETRERVVGLNTVKYRDLILSEDRDGPIDPEQAAQTLAAALSARAIEIFTANEPAAQLLNRVEFLRRTMQEHPWPVIDLTEVLSEICRGKKSKADIERADLAGALASRLEYPLDRLLTQNAPEFLQVPSGSRVRLNYQTNGPPILAVRLQEIFGLPDTPRVAAGRAAVLLHLLAPNFRPVQITDDLKSFWKTTYFQVRKDLRVRYPRHSWPEDPMSAKAEAKGGRKK